MYTGIQDFRYTVSTVLNSSNSRYLWLDGNGHGKNGAPYRMKDVLVDMEAAEGMVCKLLEAVRGLAD